ncbi:MAG: FAD-dependent oxidoreductase [Deltaproteobacteria bacterium]|nr:FAD-dependent oxidoreductase [Deltaproteobacteria bacterium]
MIHDAIVVGAGLSGLVCARRLADAGADVLVLEARDRIGGRLVNGQLAGSIVDLGGQWMSVGQSRLAALAATLGVASFPQRRDGRAILEGGSQNLVAQLATAFAQWRSVRAVGRLTRAVTRDPGKAQGLDAIALGTWLARTIRNPTARERLALHAELVFAADPADLSLLDYLYRLEVTGGFAPAGPDLPGGREHRFVGGAHALAARLAERLTIQLGAPVRAIERSGETLVTHGDTGTHAARRLVLAVPPLLAGRIDLAMPGGARTRAEASRMGPVVKCFAAYDHAFWRDAGFSGEAYLPRGTVRAIVEVNGADDTSPALLAFIVGAAAVGWRERSSDDRRAEVLATFEAHFGPLAQAPIDYLEHDWGADPWSTGCVVGHAPGVLTCGTRWGEPFDRIHLAGTETATAWPGYMEGAIEAGERAAAEVLHALGHAASGDG